MHRSIVVVLTAALLAAGCAIDRSVSQASPVEQPAATSVPSNPTLASRDRAGRAPTGVPSRSTLAERVIPLPPASGVPERRAARIPVALSYEAIGVLDAPIDGVGVLADGEMEIPGAERIGWYEYGPSPGESGSAVLAAHIAYDGRRGVFRFLGDAEGGDVFAVTFDDGSTSRYQVVSTAQYAKDELPFDEVFARSGSPVITLISCGGEFQRSLRAYEDNLVAYAVPTG